MSEVFFTRIETWMISELIFIGILGAIGTLIADSDNVTGDN